MVSLDAKLTCTQQKRKKVAVVTPRTPDLNGGDKRNVYGRPGTEQKHF